MRILLILGATAMVLVAVFLLRWRASATTYFQYEQAEHGRDFTPAFRVTIFPSGRFVYAGVANVAGLGERETVLPPERVAALFAALDAPGLFAVEASELASLPGAIRRTLTYVKSGKAQSVTLGNPVRNPGLARLLSDTSALVYETAKAWM